MEAKDGDRVLDARVLIAPGGRHMQLKRSGAQYVVEVRGRAADQPPQALGGRAVQVGRAVRGRNALGIIMTGMGDDGARGLREMHNAGAYTAAQDEASSVVFGMPAEAIKLGGADDVVALSCMADWIASTVRRPLRKVP